MKKTPKTKPKTPRKRPVGKRLQEAFNHTTKGFELIEKLEKNMTEVRMYRYDGVITTILVIKKSDGSMGYTKQSSG